MDNKKKIIDDFKKKVKLIEKHNEHYFKYDDPKISDAEYDQIKTETIKLENKFNFLKKLKLLKNNIGFTPSNKFKKVKHLRPMLSLSNVFDRKGMEEFIKKINNFLNLKDSQS